MELKPCPFFGCSMQIEEGVYQNGDPKIWPYGYHDSDCMLSAVTLHTYPEDGWTEDRLAASWNRRAADE